MSFAAGASIGAAVYENEAVKRLDMRFKSTNAIQTAQRGL